MIFAQSTDAGLQSSSADAIRQEGNHPGARIRLHDRTQSPVWLLPPEIVGYIFELYLSEPPEHLHQRIRAKSRRPRPLVGASNRTTLSLVCSVWKDIVNNHPRLWADVTAQLRPNSRFGPFTLSDDDASGFRRSLNKIAGCPWTLRLDFRRLPGLLSHSVCGQATSIPLCEVLDPKSLASLDFLHTCGEERRTGLGPLTIPSVKSLLMERDFTTSAPLPSKDDELDLPRLPGLKKVAFVEVDLATIPPQFPWQGLTHIYLEGSVTLERMLLVFRSCLGLKEASFQGDIIRHLPTYGSSPIREHIKLDHLAKLQFRDAPLDLDLSTISWPDLTHVQAQILPPLSRWHTKNLSLLRSVTHIHLSRGLDFECTKHLIPALDNWCPLLTHLVLNPNIPVDYPRMFLDLAYAEGARRLTDLEVLGVNMEDTLLHPYGWATDGGLSNLLDAVASRCGRDKPITCSQLRKLVLRINSRQWDPARDEATFKSLSRFEDRLEVVVVGKLRCRYQDVTFDRNFSDWECEGLRELTESFSHFRYSFTYQNQ